MPCRKAARIPPAPASRPRVPQRLLKNIRLEQSGQTKLQLVQSDSAEDADQTRQSVHYREDVDFRELANRVDPGDDSKDTAPG